MSIHKSMLVFGVILLLVTVACSLTGLFSPAPTETAAPPPEQPPADTPEPTATADQYAGIEHTMIPGEPVLVYWAYDCDTGRYTKTANQPVIGGGCDQWAINFIERPTNQDLSMYYPHLDITRFQMGKNETWIFADIQTYKPEGSTTVLNGTYALEIDFDMDSDGDLLVMVINPSTGEPGEWRTFGVQVWEDVNDDVGGDTPFFGEESNPGDGYEVMLFDQGLGDDPDLAWARLSPDDPATVEFAFKRSLVPFEVTKYLWWTWASQEVLVPGQFDYNDTFDDDEVYQIGNSCRWIFDGPPEPLPNICKYQQPTEEPGEEYCLIEYTVNLGEFPYTVGNCGPCPQDCDAYNEIPNMSCSVGCEP